MRIPALDESYDRTNFSIEPISDLIPFLDSEVEEPELDDDYEDLEEEDEEEEEEDEDEEEQEETE